MVTPEELRTKWRQLVARCWRDEALRQRLLTEPAAVLKENGILTPPGATVKVLQNTNALIHFTLPARPENYSDELTDAELEMVAGGAFYDALWIDQPM